MAVDASVEVEVECGPLWNVDQEGKVVEVAEEGAAGLEEENWSSKRGVSSGDTMAR